MAAGDERRFRVDDGFILKEAQAIINDYIRENRLSVLQDRRSCRKKAFWENKVVVNIMINFVLFGSIAFLLFLVIKLI